LPRRGLTRIRQRRSIDGDATRTDEEHDVVASTEHPGPTPITVAYGNGIGPEIMAATLDVLSAAGADLQIEEIEIGQSVYERGVTSGVEPSAWESLRRTKVFLKAPITTPQGGGFKSVNVTIRNALGLFANIRPCPSYAPFIATRHPAMDVVIVRENEEDLYAGIEHRQTEDVTQCLKLISRPATERIVRYAFEYAKRYDRKKVTCFTKDNIMKITDGLFHQVFDEVAAEYPEIENEHWIVDIGAAMLADSPTVFDLIVLPNLYGDILSDVAAQITGSVGLGGSANIGSEIAMFEAIHGSAPRIAGQDIANPSGLILAAIQMLVHIGLGEVASIVHNAWLKTIEDGVHTVDIYDEATSSEMVGTKAFAQAVIERLGQVPATLNVVSYQSATSPIEVEVSPRHHSEKVQVGIDVFVSWLDAPAELIELLKGQETTELELSMISNRGQLCFPGGAGAPVLTDHYRCRFQVRGGISAVETKSLIALLGGLASVGLPFVQTEGLFTFDGVQGFSVGQGQ
jgi:isocitrate dehydrogenase